MGRERGTPCKLNSDQTEGVTVEETGDYCSLVAEDWSCDMLVDSQLSRTVNELIWTRKSSANKDSC